MIEFLKNTRNLIRGYSMNNIFNIFLSKNLRKYWLKAKKENFDELLKKSMEMFIYSQDYKKTSKNHKFAIIKILKIIELHGNKESTNDFQFNNPNFHSEFTDSTISEIVKDNYENKENFIDLFKVYPSIKIENSLKLNLINNILYNKIKDKEIFEKIHNLSDETFVGNNNIFNYQKNIKITQEKLRTLIEFENILPLIKKSDFKILEIGSGNGRTCDCIISNTDKISKYILVDIPPALPFAFKRLKKSLKNKKIFFGIDIKSSEELEKKIQENDILLIFPNQLKFLKKKFFDLLIAIDCLHEMKKTTIREYMDIAEYTSKKIYFKVHENTQVPFSFDKLSIHNENDYSINPRWKKIFKKKSLFPSNDYENAYETIQ